MSEIAYPVARVDCAGTILQVARDVRVISGPEVDINVARGALHRIVSTTVRIEGRAVAVRLIHFNAAAGVAIVEGVAVRAGSCPERKRSVSMRT